jgi:hypothetical protein
MIQGYIRLKRATGLRMTDMLLLRPSDAKEDGIHVQVSKTRNSTDRKQIFTGSTRTGTVPAGARHGTPAWLLGPSTLHPYCSAPTKVMATSTRRLGVPPALTQSGSDSWIAYSRRPR